MNSPISIAPRVSVIIPSFNRCDLAVRCLESLYRQRFLDFETIVVDDASTDDTVAVLQTDFPQVTVLRQARNAGFAVAVNAGLRQARGEWVFLLNNDVTLEADCLQRLLDAAKAQQADMAAPLILWADTPDAVYSAGDRIGVNGRPESIGFRAPLEGFVFPKRIFGVTAAAGLYRRAIAERIGLLDEDFVAYFEDADWCFRARLAGFRAILAPEARAYHIGSASIEGKTWWRSAQCYRNHALLVLKNMPFPLLVRYMPQLLRERAHQMRSACTSARAAFGAAKALRIVAAAWFSLLIRLPGVLRKRHAIQKLRILSVSEIDAALRGKETP